MALNTDIYPFDRYVLETSESSGASGIVVPFEQVKTFFEQTQAETAVALSTNDPDLIFELAGHPECVARFIGTSRNWGDYGNLAKSIPSNHDFKATAHAPRRNATANTAKAARSEKKRQAQLQSRLNMMKSAVEVVRGGQDYVFFSIDIESWEKNHDIITEVGLTRYCPTTDGWIRATVENEIYSDHIIVKEHRFYKNGDYVADASGNFEFGESRFVPLAEMKAAIVSFMNAPSGNERQPVLVGHDVNMDIEYLRKLGYDLELAHFAIVFDTVEMWKATADISNSISLNRLCGELNITAWNLHNAGKKPGKIPRACPELYILYNCADTTLGNDARYTMNAFLEMAMRFDLGLSSDPIP
ncbi:hypothetical protein ABW20_dc0100069 [Dactylellina cionopaga]|nr:hypothetical protein ABW20_dc0100069 [Dactylellina cionopaga]